MTINPIHFAHGVCDEFLRYLFTAYPLADPELAEQARALLRRPNSLDMPLVRGPYVSLSEAFARGRPVPELATEGLLHPAMPELIGYPTMWAHQQEVFEAIGRRQHVLVSTGTGSGKTEAFLYPIVDDLLRQRDAGATAGVAAVLVYPMNALANDQLERLREMLGGTGISFGQWTGTTPRLESEVRVERFGSSSRQAYRAELARRREEARQEDRAVRPLAPPEECCSEEAIRQRRPRILLTNYRQLEVLTTRPQDVALFAGAPLQYLVFDEAHTYRGAVGAEVACLIRRLRGLAGKTADEVLCVGTSATLSDPRDKTGTGEEAARRFASRFFGVPGDKVALVGESYVSRDWPRHRYRSLPPRGDGLERLGRILQAVSDPVDVPAVKAMVEELTGQIFKPGDDWRAELFGHLIASEYVYQTTEILKRPKRLDDAAWQVSQRLSPGRLPQGPEATAELLAYLVLGAAARQGSESLLRPKVHLFLRGLDEMVVALEGTPKESKLRMFMSLAHGKEHLAERRDDAFFPVLTCRTCGQHFFERHYHGLRLDRLKDGRLKGLLAGNATEDDRGRENAVWATGPKSDDEGTTRLVMTNRLLEEAEGGQGDRAGRRLRGCVCRQCGALHREAADRCLADGCGAPYPLLPVLIVDEVLTSCPSCGTPAGNKGGRPIEPARRMRAIEVADVHILAQAMINAAPAGHEKLIVFSDSRQDAAFQAGWMQDHARRIRLRHMMYRIIKDSPEPIAPDAIADRLMEAFRKDQSLIDRLLPELTIEHAAAIFGSNKWVPVYRALRYMVLRELTTGVRRRDCLEAMGVARVTYTGVTQHDPGLRSWAAMLDIAPAEAAEGVSLLLDIWRRNRYLAVPNEPIFGRFHEKGNEYVQAGLLPLGDFRPGGLVLRGGADRAVSKYARQLIADRGQTAVQALVRQWGKALTPEQLTEAIELLWKWLTEEACLLTRVDLRSYKDTYLADVWQVDLERVRVQPDWERHRCTTCQRVMSRAAPGRTCSRHLCQGTTTAEEPDANDCDVWLMGRPYQMVSPEEHTAQVPGEIRNRIENDFKSRQGRTNCLVATPTLEMGVNIGALDMTLMRNVPPQPANYWQRAGRAGREERMAVVLTYCRSTSHDRYFFEDPLRLLGGEIEAPAFNLHNPVMVAKHVRSAALSELLLRSERDDAVGRRIKAILRKLVPHYIRGYLLDGNSQFRSEPPSTAPLATLLDELGQELAKRLVPVFSPHWPAEAAELVTAEAVAEAITNMPHELAIVVRRLHRRLQWASQMRVGIYDKKSRGLIEREEEQLLNRCDDFINSIIRREASTYTLSVLANEGFLPGYGVYDGGITASALRAGLARNVGPILFELQRSKPVALREFVPGNRLYANRGSYYVSRYHLAADDTSQLRTLMVNPEKGVVTDTDGASSYGQTGTVEVNALPLADLDLSLETRITEDDNLRFSMPVSIVGRLLRHHRGGQALRIGDFEVELLRGQGVELVNLGEAGRVKGNEKQLGHLVCSVCGAAKSPYAVEKEIERFSQIHRDRCGREIVPVALTAQAEVDVLRFRFLKGEAAAINIGEMIRTAAAQLLDMGPDDLQLLLIGNSDETTDLLIYDPMPGGSGLLDQILGRWSEVLTAAQRLLADCPGGCERSCYHCLRTFRNQFHHDQLDRLLALELCAQLHQPPELYRSVEAIIEQTREEAGTPSNTREAQLLRLLEQHHFPPGRWREEIKLPIGIATTPDWLHEGSQTAVYQDGMSRRLHGNPHTARHDQLRRQAMEMEGYRVIIIQSRDLDDPQAMRQHLQIIADAVGFRDFNPDGPSSADPWQQVLQLCDPSCQDLLRRIARAGLPLPEVGQDIIGTGGSVVGTAELAWGDSRVAVLTAEQFETGAEIQAAGWTVVSVEEAAQLPDQLLTTLQA